ncbi:MAG TPA: histidine kinase, partial [Thermoanaerobaculia bacterium]|nr:histidine kinase [Thermoanaerobaculia bacterium]
LFAVWLDPSEPANQAAIAYGLLIAYLVYALLVALAVTRVEVRMRGWREVAHAFDLAFFSAFVYFTAGPASPFTAYFVFSLVCSALLWGWRGTLWTAIAALTAYFGIGLWLGVVADTPAGSEPVFDLNRVIIRGVYLVVVAVLLGYLGSHGRRTLRELSALATTPQRVPRDRRELAREVLAYVREVLASPRAAIVWRPADHEEGGWRALLEGGTVSFAEEGDGDAVAMADDLADRAFLALHLDRAAPRVMVKRDSHLEAWDGRWLAPRTAAWLRPATLLSVPIRGELVRGRLFVLDRADPTSDELLLAEVVASVVAIRLDQFSLTVRLARAAADSERVRLSRDLHDGVLQALTGIALRLEAVRRESAAAGALQGLEEIQALIVREQRDLRFFIGELRPAVPGESGPGRLEARLGDLVDRLQRQFGLAVDLAVEDGAVPESLARDVYHLVREALVNAARHGGAVAARVHLRQGPGLLALTVEDSGRGFAFTGRFTGGELAARGEGPQSLRERVEALGGELVLDASPGATRLDISLPEDAGR